MIWWFLKEKGKEGYVILDVGDEIMMLDPKKSGDHRELEAVDSSASSSLCEREILMNHLTVMQTLLLS